MEGKKSTQTVGINKIKKEKVSAGKMKKKKHDLKIRYNH